MEPSIKINSISIDLGNEIDMAKCDHFSIRGFVAETRKGDLKKCWPFSEESVSLMDEESYSLPSLTVPKFKWWRCRSCIRDIDAHGTKDCGMHSNSRTIISEKKLDGYKWHSLNAIDHEKGRQADINAGNAAKENDNKDVKWKRSQKNNQTAAMFLKKVRPRSTEASTVRSKSRKLTRQERVGSKRSKEKVNNIRSWKEKRIVDTTFGSSDIAGVVEDTPPKSNKNHRGGSRAPVECDNVTSGKRRRVRKIRLLSELLGEAKTVDTIRKEEESSCSRRESVRGRKRKLLLPENNYVSRILSTNGAASDDSDSTDSGFDIKGKQKNRRFQVVDEALPETSLENYADPVGKSTLSTPAQSSLCKEKDSPVPCSTTTLSSQRTEKKLSVSRKKKKSKIDNGGKSSTLISFNAGRDEGNRVKPLNGPFMNAISQSTRDLLNEKRTTGSLFDERLASEGYYRRYIPQEKPVVPLHLQDSDHLRSNLRDFGSSSKSNVGGWLRTGVDVVDFNNNNNTIRSSFPNFDLRHTSCSTNVVEQKDGCGGDRKGKTVMVPEDQNDDIPMEIVELMAKNQYERCLPDKEDDKQTPQETTAHRSKNALLIDLNETYDNNGISLEDNNNNNNIPRPPPKPCDIIINGRKDEHFPIGNQQKSLDFFPLRQPYVPSPPFFPPPPPPQENRFSGYIQNSNWLGTGPTMASQNPSPPSFRILRPCNTCQSVPQQYTDRFWSSSPTPTRIPQKPVSLNMNQPMKLGLLPQQPSSNENNTWNLNFDAVNRKQSNSEFSFGCKHAAASVNRPVENESSIPALHLLSLLDPRLRSNTPVDHHEKTKSTNNTHFWPPPPVTKSTEIQTGDSSKTTKQLPFDFYSKRFAAERNLPMMPPPPPPPVGTPSLPFQASWSHHQQHQDKKAKRKDTFATAYNNQGKFQLLGASNSMLLPLKFHLTDKEKKQKRKAENASASVWPPRNGYGQIECCVNRNPADFTVVEPGNVYMLTGENLKVRKRTTFKKKPSLCKQDVLKQTTKKAVIGGPFAENA